jgi:hypothetical protein
LEKKVTQTSYQLSKNEKKPTQVNTNNNLEKSVKSDLFKNSEKNEEKSKVSGIESNNVNINLDPIQMQSKQNKEKFLMKTENSAFSKKINASINSNNKIDISSHTNKAFVKSEMKEIDRKSKISNSEMKSNKGENVFVNVNIDKSLKSKEDNVININDHSGSKSDFKELENLSIKSAGSKIYNNNQNISVDKDMSKSIN